MSLTRRRVHSAAADMTELFNPRPVHLGGGRARATKDQLIPRRALLSFQRPLGGVRRVSSPPPLALVSKKRAPRREGPDGGRLSAGQSWTPRYEAAPLENRCKSDREV